MASYVRRKQWEAKVLAGELGQIMAQVMGASMGVGGTGSGSTARTVGGKSTHLVSADALLFNMGARL
jgi:hypothetical protein